MSRSPAPVALALALALTLAPIAHAQTSHHHSREASGTSWQPEAAGMEGLHLTLGSWNAMIHGFAFGVLTDIAGPRGGRQVFGTNMLMMGVTRPLGGGTLGLRTMASLEPLMGRRGYRLLLQTGEVGSPGTELEFAL